MNAIQITPPLSGVEGISFLTNDLLVYRRWDGHACIWIMGIYNLKTGQMTDYTNSVAGGIAASPADPNKVALSLGDEVGIYWLAQKTKVTFPLTGMANETNGTLTWDPTGKRLIAIGFRREGFPKLEEVAVLLVFDGNLKLLKQIESRNWLSQASWRSDGYAFSYWDVDDEETYFVSFKDEQLASRKKVGSFIFSPAGTACVYLKLDSTNKSRLVLEKNGEAVKILAHFDVTTNHFPPDWISFSPDDRFLAFNGGMYDSNTVTVYDLETHKSSHWTSEKHRAKLETPTWKPDSTAIAFAAKRLGIQMLVVK